MESLLQFDEFINGVKGKALGSGDCAGSSCRCFFTSVHTDSRNVCKDSLFVPLIGEVQNGHKYIPSAIEKGASVILIGTEEYKCNCKKYDALADEYKDILFVVVENTLHGLQDAAETYVSKKCKDMIRISITGSSGKTTTKEMMVSVCKAWFGEDKVAYTKGNFNSETGLPLTAFTIRGDEKVCILEMGMNRVGEIGEISKILKSQFGIITNIGTAHIGILGSRENIAREKRKSLAYIPDSVRVALPDGCKCSDIGNCVPESEPGMSVGGDCVSEPCHGVSVAGAAFVWSGDDFGDFCCAVDGMDGDIVKFGADVPEAVSGVKFIADKGLFGSQFSVDGEVVNLPLSGEYNYLNALGVIACAKRLGVPAGAIKVGLENLGAISGRMEVKEIALKNNKKVALLKDCYNANLESMSKVIDFCNGLKDVGKKIFVLADMKELGAQSEKSHRSIGKKLNECKPDYIFLIGCEMAKAYQMIDDKENVFLYDESSDKNFEEIADKIGLLVEEKDVVLLKGSHSMMLEKMVPLLTEK